MADQIEVSIKSLIKEFSIIKNSLEPLVNDIKRMKANEVEFRKFKEDMNICMKKWDSALQKLNSEKSSKADTLKIAELEKQITQRLGTVSRNVD
jgi:hypothetical protein